MFKKILCAVAAVGIVAAMMFVSAAATEGEAQDSMATLHALGVVKGYEDGELHPEYNITRMEFAAMIMRCLGYEEVSASIRQSEFPDVESGSWGVGYVNLAKSLGMIKGYEDGNFGPEDLITVVDAATILTRAVGYNVEAAEQGGYPNGYINTAVRIGILDGISNYDDIASRGTIADMIHNSLEIKFITGNLNPSNPAYKKSDYTMLEAMGISKIRDMVTAVYGSNLSKNSYSLEKGQVVISDRIFDAKAAVDETSIGLDAYIYIKDYEDENKAQVLLVLPRAAGRRLSVDAEDVDKTTTLRQFQYWKEDKLKKVTLPENLTVIYNGAAIATSAQLTDDRLIPKTGNVTLIDGNGDGKYENIVVKEYETYVVNGMREGAIFDVYGNNFSFDESNAEIIVIKDGAYAELSDIQKGDVLNTAISLDGEKTEFIISNNAVEGKVTRTYEKNGKKCYVLDSGGEYTLTDSYITALSEGYSNAAELELGDSVKLYLNAFGEVAFAEQTEEFGMKAEYGWLDAMENRGDGTCYMRIMTQRNTYESISLKLTGKVLFGRIIDGKYQITRVEPSAIGKETGLGSFTKNQMIKYKTDSDGYITEVYLLDSKKNTENFSKDTDKANLNFAYHTIENRYYYDDNTIVFHIPSSGLYPERISAGKPSKYFSNNRSYGVELYEVDNNTKYVELIVYTASVTNYNDVYINYVNSPVMLVTDVVTETGDDGMICTMLEGYEEGKKVRRLVSDSLNRNTVVNEIKSGSVIQYATSSELARYAQTSDDPVGIVLYNVLFDCNEKGREAFALWNYEEIEAKNAKIKISYSQVARYDYPILTTTEEKGSVYELNDGTQCYKYNTNQAGSFEKIDASEIQQGDMVFIRTRYNFMKEIIVID